ncbi:hypothetical protein BH10ACT9_BH10ACT9_05650 [soil metagenome]
MTTKFSTLAAFCAAVALVSVLTGAPAARADDESCSFALSAPQFTTLPGGGPAVSATVRAVTCTGLAQATDSYVCITTPAGDNQCKRSPAWNTAEVFVTAGGNGTYTAQGKGCWAVFEQADCRDIGAVSATI